MTRRLLLLLLPACCLLSAAAVLAQETPTLGQAGRLRAQGRTEEAVRAYEAILRQAADDNERAQALQGLAAVYLGRNNERAAECYRRLIALPQAGPRFKQAAWRQLAMLARREDDLAGAREAYRHLLTDFPDDPDNIIATTLELAYLEIGEGDPRVAVAALGKLLTAADGSPRLPDVYLALIGAQAASEDFKSAEKTARAASRRFPDRPDFLRALANAYQEAGRPAEAAALLEELLAREPAQDDLFRSLYELRRDQQRLPQLTSWLEKRAAAQPAELAWLRHLAHLCEWQNDPAAALRVHERLVARRGTDATVLQEAGQAALRAKAYDKAAHWVEQALALEPDSQPLLVLSGEVQLQQGKSEAALALWKRGLHYDPRDRRSVQTLGSILARYDLSAEAAKVYTEARAAGDDPHAYALNLGQLYENLGQVAAAVREYALLLQPGGREGSSVVPRLSHLAEDEQARPELVAALQPLQQQGVLNADGTAVLVYARVLSGADPAEALSALGNLNSRTLSGLLTRTASHLEASGHSDGAIACYQRLLREPQTPDYAAGLALHLAELQSARGDWRAAVAALAPLPREAMQPELGAQVAVTLGELLLRRGHRPAEALGMFNSALDRLPEGPLAARAHWGEADVAFSLGKYDLAMQAYRTLLQQAGAREQAGEEADALPANGFARARRQFAPGPDYVQYQEAEALFRQGKGKEAATALRAFAAANAASPYANDALERVVLLQRLGQEAAAGDTYRQALLQFERGEAASAAALLEGLRASPVADAALLLLGRIRIWEGQTAAALAVLDALAASHADSPLAPEGCYLAAMALLSSDRPECQRRLEALVERYPQSPQSEQARLVLESWRRQAPAS